MNEPPRENLLTRMWVTVAEKGIGGLFHPWQIRREGRARSAVRSDEIRMLAQAERDAKDIREGRRGLNEQGKLVPAPASTPGAMTPDDAEIARRVTATIMADTMRWEINVAKALIEAEKILELDSGEAPKELPSDDWLFRWRDAAGEVSEAELQYHWGKLLAGEFKAPGTYSLRTIEILRHLSRKEAEAIKSVARFTMRGFVRDMESRPGELMKSEGIDLGLLLTMENLGVFLRGGVNFTPPSASATAFRILLPSNDKGLIVTHENAEKGFTWTGFMVSDSGREIMRLADVKAYQPFIDLVASELIEDGFSVSIGRVHWKADGNPEILDAEELG